MLVPLTWIAFLLPFGQISCRVILDEMVQIEPEPTDGKLVLRVWARTRGYVAIGFSLSGSVNGADMVMAWVDDFGKGHLIDGHGVEGKAIPVQDVKQNYKLLAATQNETHTIITFSRPMDTCDGHDVVIVNDTMKLIWALSASDPTKSEWEEVQWRGPQSVHLSIPPLRRGPGTDAHWDIQAQEITLPEQSSFYWCKIYKTPNLETKHHITGYVPILENGHEGLIEHMILYECLVGVEFEVYGSHPGAECHDSSAPKDWKSCTTPIVSWAAGSTGEFFPEHIGLPMAEGEGKATYFMLEIHYDNPALQRVRDNSGLRLFYTNELREYDGSILIAGVTPSSVQLIPPRQSKFTNTGYCDSQCTNLMFPEKGIKVVSVVFHTHSAGRQVRLRHVREGKELPPIAQDNYFDPRFQQSKRLLSEAVVLPGDDLITECTYNTQNRTRLTLGGYSVREETCLAYVLYYPRTALSSCTSMTPVDFFFDAFGVKEFYDQDMLEVEKILLKESNKSILRAVKQPVPMQSLFFRFSEKSGFNLDASRPSPSILKAMAEINLETGEDESIFSRLVIFKPDEFQNKSFMSHLKDLPWGEKLFTHSVEETLSRGKHKTFCRLQNSIPAMPSVTYNFPNFTSTVDASEANCTVQDSSTASSISSSLFLIFTFSIVKF